MPSPAQLGIINPRPVANDMVDWTAVHRRLDVLGATCIQLEKLGTGGYRFICLLPTSQANRSHRVEAEAATEAEAVRLALDRAEQASALRK